MHKFRRPPFLMFVDADEGVGTGPANPKQDQQSPTPPPPQSSRGFPEGVPVADMSPGEQAAYWKFHARKWEDRANAQGDYDDLKKKAAAFDKARAEAMSEQEKAVAAARDEGVAAGRAEASTDAASAMLRGFLTQRGLDKSEIKDLVETVNITAFVKGGEPDYDRISAYADRVAPYKRDPLVPDMGQGYRGPGTGPSQAELGRQAAMRRYNIKPDQQ